MRAMIRAAILAAIMAMGLSAGPAWAQQFTFPERVGRATQESRKDFAKQGVDFMVRYVEAGARYDMFVYDSGYAPAPAGPRRELELVVESLRLMLTSSAIQSFRQGKRWTVPSKLGRFSCMTLEVERRPGVWEDSLSCVAATKGFFVKLRASGPAKSGVVRRARAFLPAIAAAM